MSCYQFQYEERDTKVGAYGSPYIDNWAVLPLIHQGSTCGYLKANLWSSEAYFDVSKADLWVLVLCTLGDTT